jgi:hypothetical protein
MRLQLSTMLIAKCTAMLLTYLSYVVYLHYSKHINKAFSIKRKVARKSKVVLVSASCIKLANKKCKYYTA